MYNRITTEEIYDILVEKKETTFYAGNIKLEIKFSKDECLTAYLGENCVAYISNRGGYNSHKVRTIIDNEYNNYFVFGYGILDKKMRNKGIMTAFVCHIHNILDSCFNPYISVIETISTASECVASKSGFVLYDDFRDPVFVKSKELFAPQKSLKHKSINGSADALSDNLCCSITRISYVKYEFMKDSFYYIFINAEKDNGKFFKDTYNEAVQKIFEKYGKFYMFFRCGGYDEYFSNKNKFSFYREARKAGFEKVPEDFYRDKSDIEYHFAIYKLIDSGVLI